MKTFSRVVRRYVLATAAIILLLMILGVAAVIGIGYYYGKIPQGRVPLFQLPGRQPSAARPVGGICI